MDWPVPMKELAVGNEYDQLVASYENPNGHALQKEMQSHFAKGDAFSGRAGHGNSMDLDKFRIAIAKENATVEELMSSVNKLMESTQAAVLSYMMLKQPMTSSIAPFYDFYSGLPKRPSLFMQATVTRFEKYLIECDNWIEELEQFLLTADKSSGFRSSLKSLPNVCNANFELLIHVAAKVENLHQLIESMKKAFLADRRRRGDRCDPFFEANKWEATKQETAATRTHPTLHLPAISAQTSHQVAGSSGFSFESAALVTASASPFNSAQTSTPLRASAPYLASSPAVGNPMQSPGDAMNLGPSFAAPSTSGHKSFKSGSLRPKR